MFIFNTPLRIDVRKYLFCLREMVLAFKNVFLLAEIDFRVKHENDRTEGGTVAL